MNRAIYDQERADIVDPGRPAWSGVSPAARVAVVGSRDFRDLDRVRAYVAALPEGTVVVTGGALGVDQAAEGTARACGLAVRVLRPDYEGLGRVAPLLRNSEIVAECDRVVAFWRGASRGTADTIRKARRAGKPVEIVTEDEAP